MRDILISIIRHGQTDCNLRGVLQGQMETSLNATGRDEAEKLGVRLQNQTYTHVHSSNMERAEETARIVLRNNRVVAQKVKDEIQFDVRLRERSFGVFEGKPKQELADFNDKASRKKDYPGRRHFTPPNGESISTVYARARECLIEILWNVVTSITTTTTTTSTASTDSDQAPNASVLISTHGGVAIELFTFLVKELHCPPPEGKTASQMIAIPGNTALATFRLSVDDDAISENELSHVLARPTELITRCLCLNIHDRTQ